MKISYLDDVMEEWWIFGKFIEKNLALQWAQFFIPLSPREQSSRRCERRKQFFVRLGCNSDSSRRIVQKG